jgi:hypothetical protein
MPEEENDKGNNLRWLGHCPCRAEAEELHVKVWHYTNATDYTGWNEKVFCFLGYRMILSQLQRLEYIWFSIRFK